MGGYLQFPFRISYKYIVSHMFFVIIEETLLFFGCKGANWGYGTPDRDANVTSSDFFGDLGPPAPALYPCLTLMEMRVVKLLVDLDLYMSFSKVLIFV